MEFIFLLLEIIPQKKSHCLRREREGERERERERGREKEREGRREGKREGRGREEGGKREREKEILLSINYFKTNSKIYGYLNNK